MKVFISHSAKDKWAARRIAKDLHELAIETFLDEKDIETGASIDDSIRSHLAECDDVLILLSPASIESQWVLMELGGAMALGKHLVPILLYIGANEIPQAIGHILARDINEVDLYYDEITKRPKRSCRKPTPESVTRTRKRKRRETRFAVGDTVVLPPSPQDTVFREGVSINWSDEMTQYCGQKGRVTRVAVKKLRSVQVDTDGGEFWWAFEWLKKRART